MTYKKIQALMLKPGELPTPVTLSTSESSLRKAVNIGSDHHYRPLCKRIDGDICVVYNSRLIGSDLVPNRLIDGEILRGVIYIVAITSENKLRSLNFDEIAKYIKRYYVIEEYTVTEARNTNLTYLYNGQVRGKPSKEVKINYTGE